ncbi:MAG TPA: hypothetical protein VFQ76_09360, partial [Longimicrobiaceae bacterium]|nr:hypothetical protein [Longimicrobiaceae bacterium]
MAKRKLELDRQLEAAAVAYAVLDSKFYGVVGYALDAEQMPSEPAQLIVKARHEVEKSTKGGPCSPRLIAQRFRIWRHAGQVTLEEAGAAMDWLRDAEASVERSKDKAGVQQALVEVLKFHLNSAAVDMAMSLHSKRKTDMSVALKLFEKAAKLGVYEAPQRLSSQDENLLERISTGKQDRLPTGIAALDDALDGGTARGELGFCI